MNSFVLFDCGGLKRRLPGMSGRASSVVGVGFSVDVFAIVHYKDHHVPLL